jgi:hypothetical protein
MKKKILKRQLEITKEALKLYRGYMIDGKRYADDALYKLYEIENEHNQKNYEKVHSEVVKTIIEVLKDVNLIK